MHTAINISGLFANAGIVPSKTTEYEYSAFTPALQKGFPGITPMIGCTTAYNKEVIYTVVYCLTAANPPQVFQCPEAILNENKSNCPSKIYYPTIDFESDE